MADKKRNSNLTRINQSQAHFFVSEEEKELLKRKAKSFGLSLSDYMRNMIIHGSVKAQSRLTDEQFQALLNELNHIGVNINQIAYRVNAARNASREDFNDLKHEYEQLLNLYSLWAQY